MANSLAGRGSVILPQVDLGKMAANTRRLQAGILQNKQKRDQEDELKAQANIAKLLDINPSKLYRGDADEVYSQIDDLKQSTAQLANKYGGYRNVPAMEWATLNKKRQEVNYKIDQAQQHLTFYDENVKAIKDLKQKDLLNDKTLTNLDRFASAKTIDERNEVLNELGADFIVMKPPIVDFFKGLDNFGIKPSGYEREQVGTEKGSGRLLYKDKPVYSPEVTQQIDNLALNTYPQIQNLRMMEKNDMTYGQAFPTVEKFKEAIYNHYDPKAGLIAYEFPRATGEGKAKSSSSDLKPKTINIVDTKGNSKNQGANVTINGTGRDITPIPIVINTSNIFPVSEEARKDWEQLKQPGSKPFVVTGTVMRENTSGEHKGETTMWTQGFLGFKDEAMSDEDYTSITNHKYTVLVPYTDVKDPIEAQPKYSEVAKTLATDYNSIGKKVTKSTTTTTKPTKKRPY
jgi:hypothetical protein